MNKKYYVYKIQFADLTYYIGYRGSCQLAADDFLIKYFSSSKIVAQKIKIVAHTGVILHENLEKEVAYNIEQKLIFNCLSDPLCLNKVSYYGRQGFGILSARAKEKIGYESSLRWQDPLYRERLIAAHKKRWADNPDLKAKQTSRLKGKKRPEHSAALKGHPGHKKCKGVKKPIGFGDKVSAALKGKPKSEQHRRALSLAKKNKPCKTRKIKPVIDHMGQIFDNEKRLEAHYGLGSGFFNNLDVPIRYAPVYKKLNILYTTDNRKKTKRGLGFRFKEESI